jgi:hypothetical protein
MGQIPNWVGCYSRARELAAVARRILVISFESSHHQYEAISVFARTRMCGHLPLVRSAYAKKPII